MATSEPIDLFYSYAHKDEVLRDELAAQLSILERKGVLRSWHDRRIEGGQDWNAQIDTRLKTADLILLLVSADFIKSDYIWGNELTVAMARSASGEAAVVPVLVRPCVIDDAPFASLQGLPTDLKPVTSWANRDEAWVDVVKGIRKVVLALQAKLATVASPASPPQVPAQASRPLRPPKPVDGLDLAFAVRTDALRIDGPLTIGPADAPPAADPRIDAVVDSFNAAMDSASQARGGVPFDAPAAAPAAHALIDRRAQSRVLWVDDQPEGNQGEMAALRKLQIEVVAVTSTAQALARIDEDADEPFDLVLSDWARPGEADKPAGIAAGVWLLRELRGRGNAVPVVFYHGEFDSRKRASRRAQAMQEGAFGEAVLPDELLQLVSAALTAR